MQQTRWASGPVWTGPENLAPLPQEFEHGTVIQKFTGLYSSQFWRLNLGDFCYVRPASGIRGTHWHEQAILFTFNYAGSKQRSTLLISNNTNHFACIMESQ
jgi:hypothetical protein